MRNISTQLVTSAALGKYGSGEVQAVARRILLEDLVTDLKTFGRQAEGNVNNRLDVVDLLLDYMQRGAELMLKSSKRLRRRGDIHIEAMTRGESLGKLYDRLREEELLDEVDGCPFTIRGDKRKFRFDSDAFHRCCREGLTTWETLLNVCAI